MSEKEQGAVAQEGERNFFDQVSTLSLTIAPGKIRNLSFTAPFKVLRPFHAQDFLQIMVAKVSAGLMAGDRQELEIRLEDGACAEFLSQSYEKIHRMERGKAKRIGTITVGRGAVLYYAPLPVLPFADSAFQSSFAIALADESSRLFYSDVLACGRAARQERFAYRLYESRVRVRRADRLIYADHLRFAPQAQDVSLEGFTGYEGCTHLGTFLFFGFPLEEEKLRGFAAAHIPEQVLWGVTRLASGDLCLKALAQGSEPLVRLQQACKEFLGRKISTDI